jgi:transcriptional regulator of acetoin/glycerol metabolism
VRELHAVLARAALRSNGAVIRARDLDLAGGVERAACEEVVTLERRMIEAALRDAAGGIAGAAERIGWTRQKLYRRMEALGVKIGNGIAPDE